MKTAIKSLVLGMCIAGATASFATSHARFSAMPIPTCDPGKICPPMAMPIPTCDPGKICPPAAMPIPTCGPGKICPPVASR